MESQKEKIMRLLDVSAEEAQEIMDYDRQIDKGANLGKLTAQQEKDTRQYRQAERKKPTVYDFSKKRTRKENVTKSGIIEQLAEFLQGSVENVEVVNKERQIAFSIGDDSFELTLVQKRKPKG